MKYVTTMGSTHVATSVDDYKAKFSQYDLHHQALRIVAEDMVVACMDVLIESMRIESCLDRCHARDLIKPPNEVQLVRIDKPFKDEAHAGAHLAKPMEDILADVEYRAFTTTVQLY
jgi:hypothetical protein